MARLLQISLNIVYKLTIATCSKTRMKKVADDVHLGRTKSVPYITSEKSYAVYPYNFVSFTDIIIRKTRIFVKSHCFLSIYRYL